VQFSQKCQTPFNSDFIVTYHNKLPSSNLTYTVGLVVIKALMKENTGSDFLAVAWAYPGQALEVIPAKFSLVELSCYLDFNCGPCLLDINCGATLETWKNISGYTIADLYGGTNNFATTSNVMTRLANLLEGPSNIDDNYGSRMKGWLVPPISGDYTFWIASDDNGELWLSTDSDPLSKVLVCYQPLSAESRSWNTYPGQKSSLIALVAGQAYYYEVRVCQMYTTSECSVRYHDK
jgi:hypothetical protein